MGAFSKGEWDVGTFSIPSSNRKKFEKQKRVDVLITKKQSNQALELKFVPPSYLNPNDLIRIVPTMEQDRQDRQLNGG